MTAEIFKVQRPLMSTEADAPWLFYNRSSSIYFTLPNSEIPKEVRDMVGNDLKMYVRGYIPDDGQFNIIGRVPDQLW